LIGLIADPHSNMIALKVVLLLLERRGVEMILSAGDLVGYNPYPNETVELFRKNKVETIYGNHDKAVLTGDTSTFNPYAASAIDWTRGMISRENLNYMRELKGMISKDISGLKIRIFHGSPRDEDEYVFPENFHPGLLRLGDADILVLGHTHVQYLAEYREGVIVNPGSVGQPRDGDPRAACAVLDTEKRRIELLRVDYDIKHVMEDIVRVGLPTMLAERLMFGW